MGNSQAGGQIAAAKRMRITVESYRAHVDAGEKWCTYCQEWRAIALFKPARRKLRPYCTVCKGKRRHIKTTVSGAVEPRPAPGEMHCPALACNTVTATRYNDNHAWKLNEHASGEHDGFRCVEHERTEHERTREGLAATRSVAHLAWFVHA